MSMAITGTSLAVSTSHQSGGRDWAGTVQTVRAVNLSSASLSKDSSVTQAERPMLEGDLKRLADLLQPFQIALKFSRDDETGAIVIQVFDERTGEMLRQIPPEATLRLSAALGRLQGQVFNRRA